MRALLRTQDEVPSLIIRNGDFVGMGTAEKKPITKRKGTKEEGRQGETLKEVVSTVIFYPFLNEYFALANSN